MTLADRYRAIRLSEIPSLLATELTLALITFESRLIMGGLMPCQMFFTKERFTTVTYMSSGWF